MYKIKELFQGRQLLGCDSPEIGIKDISARDREWTSAVSASSKDRFGDIVVQEGLIWSPNWWPKNAIIPFAHNYSQLPVAKGVSKPWVEKTGNLTKTHIRAKMGSHPDALQVWSAISRNLPRFPNFISGVRSWRQSKGFLWGGKRSSIVTQSDTLGTMPWWEAEHKRTVK